MRPLKCLLVFVQSIFNCLQREGLGTCRYYYYYRTIEARRVSFTYSVERAKLARNIPFTISILSM
jgi:hypothetical protein